MNLSEVIFLDSLPSVDLHGYDCDSARVKVNEFVKDNYIMGNQIIVIVHGIGSGAVKREVHNTLRVNKLVEEYKVFYNNVGCTIVKIKCKV